CARGAVAHFDYW
nr:immunoglobulin heavy chain junction region [Mus musculus]